MPRVTTDPDLASRISEDVVRRVTFAEEDNSGLEPGFLAELRAGERRAWAELYRRYFDTVLRHVSYLTGDPPLAEDLVQDVFARALVSVERYDGRANVLTWLRGIALNVVRMHWRRKKSTAKAHDRLGLIAEVSHPRPELPEAAHLREQRLRVLYTVLGTLPEHLREAFVLRDMEGLSTKDASEALGISPGNLAVRASRARAQIKDGLVRLGWLEGEGGAR